MSHSLTPFCLCHMKQCFMQCKIKMIPDFHMWKNILFLWIFMNVKVLPLPFQVSLERSSVIGPFFTASLSFNRVPDWCLSMEPVPGWLRSNDPLMSFWEPRVLDCFFSVCREYLGSKHGSTRSLKLTLYFYFHDARFFSLRPLFLILCFLFVNFEHHCPFALH